MEQKEEKSVVQIANEKCKEFLEKINEELNRNTVDVERRMGNLYTIPVIRSVGNYTKASGDAGAFALNRPEYGIFNEETKQQRDKEMVVIRRYIPYTVISRIIHEDDVKSLLLPYTTEMILTLKSVKGFGSETLNAGLYGTFRRPGVGYEYFRDLEKNAGIELRLYSDCWQCDFTGIV